MPNLDDMFIQEFKTMMNQRKAMTGPISVHPQKNSNNQVIKDDFPISSQILSKQTIMKTNLVYIQGIEDEYYSKLNGLTCMLLTKVRLERKKIDYKGNYILDKNGNIEKERVPVSQGCVAVIAEIPIGVTTAYERSNKSECKYVDTIEKTINGVNRTLFIYIIPKKYCYMVNQSALILTTTKLGENSVKGRFYFGLEMAMTNGYYAYMYVIPYNPIRQAGYRIIATGTKPENLLKVASEVYKFWIVKGVVFFEGACETPNSEKGIENVAKRNILGNITEYEYHSPTALDNESLVDLDITNTDFEDNDLMKEEIDNNIEDDDNEYF